MPPNVWLITDQLQTTRTERKTNNKSHCYLHHQRDSGEQVHFLQDLEPFLPIYRSGWNASSLNAQTRHVILYCALQPRPPTLLRAFLVDLRTKPDYRENVIGRLLDKLNNHNWSDREMKPYSLTALTSKSNRYTVEPLYCGYLKSTLIFLLSLVPGK